MLTGRRFKVRLTPDQLAYAEQVSGVCRAVWNTGLDQRRQYRQRRAWINFHQQAKELAETKLDPEFAWLKDAPGHCLQQTLMDLDKACRAHGTWKVKFRSKEHWSPSFRFPEGKHMRVQRLSKRWGQVNLPKFGQVRFRWTRNMGGTVRSATLTRDGAHGHWHISLLVQDGPATPAPKSSLCQQLSPVSVATSAATQQRGTARARRSSNARCAVTTATPTPMQH